MKKVIKYIGIMFAFIFGFFIVGNTDNIKAENFVLSDGTISEVTYNENQILISPTEGYIVINYDSVNNVYNIVKKTSVWTNCTYNNTDNSLKCSIFYPFGPSTNSNSISGTSTIYGGSNTIHFIGKNNISITSYGITAIWYVVNSYTETDINNAYQQGQESVDITTDNQAYADQYIEDNNYHTNEDYLNYGNSKHTEGYNKGYSDGSNGVDITTDNQTYADQYIKDNNYHTNEDYLSYGESKHTEGYNKGYTAGQESVDITTDNEEYALQYIEDNNYYSSIEYYNYGVIENKKGINTGVSRGYLAAKHAIEMNTYENIEITMYDPNNAYNPYESSYNLKTTLDIFITNNNYHSDNEYLEYGNTKYTNGYNTATTSNLNIVKNKVSSLFPNLQLIEYSCSTTTSGSIICYYSFKVYIQDTYNMSYSEGVSSVDITTDNLTFANQYIIDNNYHTDEDYLSYGNEQSAAGYTQGRTDGKVEGYQKANDDGKILGGFIPSLLGGFGSFFLTIMNIDILGFNLLTLFGIFITIASIVIIVKFLKG